MTLIRGWAVLHWSKWRMIPATVIFAPEQRLLVAWDVSTIDQPLGRIYHYSTPHQRHLARIRDVVLQLKWHNHNLCHPMSTMSRSLLGSKSHPDKKLGSTRKTKNVNLKKKLNWGLEVEWEGNKMNFFFSFSNSIRFIVFLFKFLVFLLIFTYIFFQYFFKPTMYTFEFQTLFKFSFSFCFLIYFVKFTLLLFT